MRIENAATLVCNRGHKRQNVRGLSPLSNHHLLFLMGACPSHIAKNWISLALGLGCGKFFIFS